MSTDSETSLPGTHRTRVFVGGSYDNTTRLLLGEIEEAVREKRFEPILADKIPLLRPDLDVHDFTLFLLHACRLGVFEVSTPSGALMELERCRDYGFHRVLVLYRDRVKRVWPQDEPAWKMTAMLKSFLLENSRWIAVRPYTRPQEAVAETHAFLRAIRRNDYGKLHSL